LPVSAGVNVLLNGLNDFLGDGREVGFLHILGKVGSKALSRRGRKHVFIGREFDELSARPHFKGGVERTYIDFNGDGRPIINQLRDERLVQTLHRSDRQNGPLQSLLVRSEAEEGHWAEAIRLGRPRMDTRAIREAGKEKGSSPRVGVNTHRWN
jgi:hypothetical protein